MLREILYYTEEIKTLCWVLAGASALLTVKEVLKWKR